MAAKKVALLTGYVLLRTRIDPAVDKESTDVHTVCVGDDDGKKPHAPIRVKQSTGCPTCERTHSSAFGFPKRGRDVGNEVVLVTAEEIKAASGAPRTGGEKDAPIELAFHPREKVYAATVAADSVQNIYPEKGSEKAYVVLRDALAEDPSIVATMIWAPSSANALWVLEVVGERIVASKRHWPETVRATVAIPEVDVSAAERKGFAQLVKSMVTDFDLSVYSDERKRNVEELLSQAGAVTAGSTAAAPSTDPMDLLAGIQASLAKVANKPVKKAPAKKAAAKKAPAKRAAKKTATPLKVAS